VNALSIRPGLLLAALVLSASVRSPAHAAATEKPPVPAAEIEALVASLGDRDYAVRESANRRLADLGLQAADALLTAAETSTDVEVALRARWLVASLPLIVGGDAIEAATLLDRFASRSYADRVRIMHRLLRLDDDAGIEPLARIVRIERSAAGSRIAAALLVREWQPDDPSWPPMAARVLVGLGQSRRPAARFLRSLVSWSAAESAAGRDAAVDEAVAAAAVLTANQETADEPIGMSAGESLGIARTGRIFRRHLAVLLARAGRNDQALEEARRILASARDEADPDEQLATELEWLVSRGLPQAVDLLADDPAAPDASPLVTYAAAVAWRKRPGDAAQDRATALADAARDRLAAADDLPQKFRVAMMLARWGVPEWALREYRGVLDDPDLVVGQRALAAVYCAEFLHEQDRDAEAAAVLAAILEPKDDLVDRILSQLERDPQAMRSRMIYFRASAAEDEVARRRLLEESLRVYSKDVDSLIALYNLKGNTAAQRAEAAARVRRATDAIENQIAALPDDTQGKNEYAWLVANTEGDLGKATRYSRETLETSFDNSSYLDTLAHCQAAAGDLRRAVRTQWLALKQEPHSPLIRRNYDRFVARAAGDTPTPRPAAPR